jgi:hypothetical protein
LHPLPFTPPTLHPATLALGDYLQQPPMSVLPTTVVTAQENGVPGGERKHWLKKLVDRLAGPESGPQGPFSPGATADPRPFPRHDSDLDSLRSGVSF